MGPTATPHLICRCVTVRSLYVRKDAVYCGVVSLTGTRVDPSAGYKTLPGIGLRQFLMPDRFADDGFLFAFVAYFVAETPVRLQVWRPVGDPSSTDHYQLVCQQRVDVTADQLSQRIVVRITSHTHTHTHTRLTALFPGLPRSAGTRKVKPIWILLKQESVSGSGFSWAICKSAPHSRQITTPAPHHSVFTGRMPFLPPNQQRQSTEG